MATLAHALRRTGTAWRRILPAEIVGDGTQAGMLGASALALFFLLFDAVRREALYTPSLLGNAILRGIPPAQQPPVDLGMVAAYSALHGAAFVAVGILAALVTGLRRESVATPSLGFALFAVLELGFLAACAFVEPALLAAVGVPAATAGNALAAAAMALYLHRWPHDAIEERRTGGSA